ncbi:MAG: fused signal recognition particle receptor [Desulfuromonadales bacterium]|nr:fused signal recognition particle receptor [Desulfuromonadales bacterium]
MEFYFRCIEWLAGMAARAGVPEANRALVATVVFWAGLTLVVVLGGVLLRRLLRRSPAEETTEAAVSVEEPAVEEPAVEEPAVEEPAVEEPAVEEPAVEEPAVEEPAVEEPAVEEPAVEEPAVEEPAVEEPAVEEPAVEEPAVEEPAVEEPAGLLRRMRAGLAKTQASLVGRIDALLRGRQGVDEELLEELEEILITADLGMKTTQQLIQALEERLDKGQVDDPAALRSALKDEIRQRLEREPSSFDLERATPFVIMVVGVNGVGKTTTIGKLAHQFVRQGKKVLVGAGDTFRAAAAEQLEVWGQRAGVEVIRQAAGSDPAAVAFDAIKAAQARKADVLLLDTAGRLHTKVNLMEELKKIRRVLDREMSGAPHETLLVVDATTGQNALVQARLFQEAVSVSALALTKLDGTARGGMLVAIGEELGLPIHYVGIGEGIEDLRPFDADLFVEALFKQDG